MFKYSSDDAYFFSQGKLIDAKRIFGSFVIKNDKGFIVGTRFTVFAPNALSVSVVGQFNAWHETSHTMTKIDASGVYSIEIPWNLEWATYKYVINTNKGKLYKADPYATFAEERPNTGSKVYDIDGYIWQDQDWLYGKKKVYQEPLAIYELHLGSWRRKYGEFFKYNEMVEEIIKHLKEQHFTHVELMPVYEHPLDDSWGYQGTGYFAATSRYGVPKDLMYMIDRLHQENIGVIMDWVPGHICKDAHGLYHFDGTSLYEYDDAFKRENEVWGTANLDLSKGHTRSFLISNACFWMDYFHVDGFRVDAVSNLVYYLGDLNNGVNHGAVDFLRRLSETLFLKDDRVLLMAEDSTAFDGVTRPVDLGGLGFNYKWNMGFMNDVLRYFKREPIYRKWHHSDITFGLTYAFSEQFILPFSHDEVVHGKGTLLTRMPGDYWQKFANYRLLIGLWMTHPGKKLLFMGQEFAHFQEWSVNRQLDWNLFDFPSHDKANLFVRTLLELYQNEKSLFELDHDKNGFKWIDSSNSEQSIFSFVRYAKDLDEHVIVILNMTPSVYHNYQVGVPSFGAYNELINSDYESFGGSGQYNGASLVTIDKPMHGFEQSIKTTIGPLSVSIMKYQK
ncbi:MAG TPA: 1,4-alpha-glucan branching protein GlgB [Acholeplasma sp.]|nr:1,4-alpha-glucan branching protein GlgB [Acholeplasma sp.]